MLRVRTLRGMSGELESQRDESHGPRGARVFSFARARSKRLLQPRSARELAPRDNAVAAESPLRELLFWLPWWCMAWTAAALRLHAAAAQHEVFGLDASLAFMIAVVLPLMAAKRAFRIVSYLRTALRARRSRRS